MVETGRRPAGLARVLAAAIYDALLTLAIAFIATAFALLYTGGEAIPAGSVIYEFYLLAAAFPYFAWCWTHGGQTLGMRAWHLRLYRDDNTAITLNHAVLRYLGALLSWIVLGLGFLWLLIGPEHRSWHDRISTTRIMRESVTR